MADPRAARSEADRLCTLLDELPHGWSVLFSKGGGYLEAALSDGLGSTIHIKVAEGGAADAMSALIAEYELWNGDRRYG